MVRGAADATAAPRLPVGYALLAHSVEHFHGKEEVVGSIPTEGSRYLAA